MAIITFVQFIYQTFVLPPGIFIVALLALGGLLWRKRQAGAKPVLGLALALYLVSNLLVAGLIMHPLEYKFWPPKEPDGDVIVMLTGGAVADTPNTAWAGHVANVSANRVITVAQLYRQYRLPILISGGTVAEFSGNEAEIAKAALVGMGVPVDKILVENASQNTAQNVMLTKELLARQGFSRPIVVTSAFHMPRAVLQFAKAGVVVGPYPTGYFTNAALNLDFRLSWPSAAALEMTALAVKEYMGILAVNYY